MGGLKKMIKQFVENFKKTEFYTDHSLQFRILLAGIIGGILVKLFPSLEDGIRAISIISIVLFGPMTIMAIYDGFANKDKN